MLRSTLRLGLVSALILNLVIGPVPALAQNAPADVPSITIRTSTRLVIVDVVVTDKKGQPIAGLTSGNFTVEENGKQQRISIFAPPNTQQGTPQLPPLGILSNRPEHIKPAGVPTLLLLDAANSGFLDQAYGRSQMLKYVLEQAQSGKPMAVAMLTDQLHVLQQFTTDPQILTTAIKNLRPEQPILQPGGAATVVTADSNLRPAAAQAIAAAQQRLAALQGVQAGFALERRKLITIEALRTLSRMLGGFQGRKNVVWLTADFPFDLIPEDTNMNAQELAGDLPSIRQKSVITVSAGAAAEQARLSHAPEIREAQSQLASAGIAIYPVDMRGLMVSGIDVNTTFALRELAAETGGKAYVNQNEIKDGIALAVADENASYTIGYYPENKKWDGKFRKIKVKLDRDDTEVRYRKGYFAIEPGPAKDRNFEQDVAAALQLSAPATQVSFMAQAKPSDPGKLKVVFLVDAHTLSAEDSGGGKKMNISLYAALYDSSGKMLGNRRTDVNNVFDTATYQQIIEKGMMVPLDLDFPSAAKEIRLAVLDNKTGLIGTVNGPLGQ